MKLLLTATYHQFDENSYTFFIMDSVTKKVTHKVPYLASLDHRPCDTRPCPEELHFKPFGITNGDGKIFVAANYNIASYDENTLDFIEIVSTSGVPHVHEIKYDNGYLFRANTTNDTISRIDLSTKEEIHFSFKTMAREATLTYPTTPKLDVFHINSITPFDGGLYVLAHNRYQKRSEVFVVDKDLTNATKLANLDYACHDLIVHDGKIYSFGSQRGVLVTLDLETLRVTKKYIVNSDDYFLRGGVVVDGKLMVFANAKVSANFMPYELEVMPNAHIITIDLATGDLTNEETTEFSSIADIEIFN